MGDDDELCLCFHVTRRKIKQFIRVERPRVVSEVSACFGAGTGCGWCRGAIAELVRRNPTARDNPDFAPTADGSDGDCGGDDRSFATMNPHQYAEARRRFRRR